MPVLTTGRNGLQRRHHFEGCLTNLVTKQLWPELTYTNGSFAVSNLRTSHRLPTRPRLLNHLDFWLRRALCLRWLTGSTLYSCSLPGSPSQTTHTPGSDDNVHWFENLKDSRAAVPAAWPRRKIPGPVWMTFPSGRPKCRAQTITTTSYSNSLQCISLSGLVFHKNIGKIQNNSVHRSNSLIE